MGHLHVKYLLLGGGLASSTAAEAIRERDAEGSVLLVGVEPTRPYHRPPLSKAFLRWDKTREDLFTVKKDWFAQNRIELRTGVRATRLDTARHTVWLDSGDEVAFDKLLLATGVSPRLLPVTGAKAANVHYLRNLNDAERLHHSIEKARSEGRAHDRGRGRAIVVGGGLLGVELAASLTELGLAVDLVLSGPHAWRKFAGEGIGHFLTRYLQSRGVVVHPNAPPERIEGEGRAQRVILGSGVAIPCDVVVIAIGAVVNKELLRNTPIIAEKAILTDEHCRTSVPNIYAAGDCAAVFDPLFGKHRLLDHWDNAVITGRLAGHNMTGVDERYDGVNHYFSEVFDLRLQAWGESRHIARRLMRGVPTVDSPTVIEFGIGPDGRVSQVLGLGRVDIAQDEILGEFVRRRVTIDGNEEAMKDPAMPLGELLR